MAGLLGNYKAPDVLDRETAERIARFRWPRASFRSGTTSWHFRNLIEEALQDVRTEGLKHWRERDRDLQDLRTLFGWRKRRLARCAGRDPAGELCDRYRFDDAPCPHCDPFDWARYIDTKLMEESMTYPAEKA